LRRQEERRRRPWRPPSRGRPPSAPPATRRCTLWTRAPSRYHDLLHASSAKLRPALVCASEDVCSPPQLANYNSFEGVLYCRPHFDQLFKRTGSLDKSFEGMIVFPPLPFAVRNRSSGVLACLLTYKWLQELPRLSSQKETLGMRYMQRLKIHVFFSVPTKFAFFPSLFQSRVAQETNTFNH
jgi:hypothetical protein